MTARARSAIPRSTSRKLAVLGSGSRPSARMPAAITARSVSLRLIRSGSSASASARLASAAAWAGPLTSKTLRTRPIVAHQLVRAQQVAHPQAGEAVGLAEGAHGGHRPPLGDERGGVVAVGGQVLEVGLVDHRKHAARAARRGTGRGRRRRPPRRSGCWGSRPRRSWCAASTSVEQGVEVVRPAGGEGRGPDRRALDLRPLPPGQERRPRHRELVAGVEQRQAHELDEAVDPRAGQHLGRLEADAGGDRVAQRPRPGVGVGRAPRRPRRGWRRSRPASAGRAPRWRRA